MPSLLEFMAVIALSAIMLSGLTGMTLTSFSVFKSVNENTVYLNDLLPLQRNVQKLIGTANRYRVYDSASNARSGGSSGLATSGGKAVRLAYATGRTAVLYLDGKQLVYQNLETNTSFMLIDNLDSAEFGIGDPNNPNVRGLLVGVFTKQNKRITVYADSL